MNKVYYWVATPLITASDTEGAGEMFRVSTLDLENLPRGEDGKSRFQPRLLRQRIIFNGFRPVKR